MKSLTVGHLPPFLVLWMVPMLVLSVWGAMGSKWYDLDLFAKPDYTGYLREDTIRYGPYRFCAKVETTDGVDAVDGSNCKSIPMFGFSDKCEIKIHLNNTVIVGSDLLNNTVAPIVARNHDLKKCDDFHTMRDMVSAQIFFLIAAWICAIATVFKEGSKWGWILLGAFAFVQTVMGTAAFIMAREASRPDDETNVKVVDGDDQWIYATGAIFLAAPMLCLMGLKYWKVHKTEQWYVKM